MAHSVYYVPPRGEHFRGRSTALGVDNGNPSSHAARMGKGLRSRRPRQWGRIGILAIVMAIGFMFGTMVQAFELQSSDAPSAQAAAAAPSSMPSSESASGNIAALTGAEVPGDKAAVVVMPGDSLWSIARTHAPEGIDIRKYVHALRQANRLDGSMLQVGQLLVLP